MRDTLSPTKRALIALKQLQDKLSALESKQRSPIAVVVVGCRFPGGANSPASFWQLLRDRQTGLSEVPATRWQNITNPALGYGGFVPHLKEFDAQWVRIAPKEVLSLAALYL